MARLKFSRPEAEAEATRLAQKIIAARSDCFTWRHLGTHPDTNALPSRGSKHPIHWIVTFAPIPRGGEIIDGGELIMTVNLETGLISHHMQ